MSFRGGRGRGRGRGGFGGGRGRQGKQVEFELFPAVGDLGTATEVKSLERKQLIRWSYYLQTFYETSPYYYEGEVSKKVIKSDIERYSDREVLAKAKQTLEEVIEMGRDYMPAEIAGDKKGKRGVKRIRWNPDADWHKLDLHEQRELKSQGQEGNEDKEDEDEEPVNEEDDGEFSDEGDYEQNEHFDDDEDDYNQPDEEEEDTY